jgi:hypothetical protein
MKVWSWSSVRMGSRYLIWDICGRRGTWLCVLGVDAEELKWPRGVGVSRR